MLKVVASFLVLFSSLHASVFDWFQSSLAPNAQRVQDLLEGKCGKEPIPIDEVVQKWMADYQVPGVAIGVVVDGQLAYAKGFGLRDLEKQLPVTKDTVFAIGSCTKAFTSFLVGTLVDEGYLDWDRKVIDVLPEFRLWDPQATQKVTFRDLLTHRTGMPRHDFMWYNSSMDRAEVLRRLRYLEPSCDFRERSEYANLMYLTAGYAMEKITGKTWEELLSEKVLRPLKMKHTNFSAKQMQQSSNFAYPYIEKKEGLKKMSLRDISVAAPVGAINSSVTDLAHWVAMHLQGGFSNQRSLISPAILQEMHAPQAAITGPPESEETILPAYGLGWIVASYRGYYYVSHDGGIDGFTSVVGFFPEEGVGIIVLSNKNLTQFPRKLSFEIIDRIFELPYKAHLETGMETLKKSKEHALQERSRTKQQSIPCRSLEEYVGNYEHPGYGTLVVEQCDGHLQATLHGITYFLEHEHHDVFTVAQESEEILFSRAGMPFAFRSDAYGTIEDLRVPFETKVSDIVFKKAVSCDLADLVHLRSFTGCYEIYGYTVEIILRDKALWALIPGHPLYELVQTADKEFSVKEMIGYSLRFCQNDQGKVEEIVVNQPYGALIARPKTPPLGGR